MRKFISFFGFVCICSTAFCAGSGEYISDAKSLADAGFIVSHGDSASLYRLNEPILRQEVVGLLLKSNDILMPRKYSCEGLFPDILFRYDHPNNWVCRVFEIGKQVGMVSGDSNGAGNPRQNITRSEALGMVAKVFDASVSNTAVSTSLGFPEESINPLVKEKRAPWQEEILAAMYKKGVISWSEYIDFHVNVAATRGEVFHWVATILRVSSTGQAWKLSMPASLPDWAFQYPDVWTMQRNLDSITFITYNQKLSSLNPQLMVIKNAIQAEAGCEEKWMIEYNGKEVNVVRHDTTAKSWETDIPQADVIVGCTNEITVDGNRYFWTFNHRMGDEHTNLRLEQDFIKPIIESFEYKK